MAFDLKSITTGTVARPPRILLAGVEKVGKTEFSSQAPSPIFIQVKGEQGADALDVASFPVAQSFPDVIAAITTLAKETHEYQTVVVDSVSALEPLVWDETCRRNGNVDSIEKVGGGFGKGFLEALKCWRELLDGLDHLRNEKNLTVILIGHVKVKLTNSPLVDPYDSFVVDLQDRAAALLYRWVDAALFAGRKPTTKKIEGKFQSVTTHAIGGDRSILFTSPRAGIPAGGRGVYGRLPGELPLEWVAYADAIAAASNK